MIRTTCACTHSSVSACALQTQRPACAAPRSSARPSALQRRKRFRRGAARVLRRDDPCQREAHSAFHREKYRYKPAKACGTDHRGGDRAAVHCQQRFRHFRWLMLCALRHRTEMTCAAASKRMTTSFCVYTTRRGIFASYTVNRRFYPTCRKPKRPHRSMKRSRRASKRDISFVYPYAAQTKLATKVAASALAAEQARNGSHTFTPGVLSAKGLTPAERGTALHNFMQFADFFAASKDPKAELKRLIEQSYLTEAQANAVDLTRVEKVLYQPARAARFMLTAFIKSSGSSFPFPQDSRIKHSAGKMPRSR